MSILIGVVADDFTGATDIANTLVKEGMRVLQVIGVPQSKFTAPFDAVVVALKSRTAPVDEAVSQSMAAAEWLLENGAEQIIFKYCSTFDSTQCGNIGPVADAMQKLLGAKQTVICPSFPENGRVVKDGHLFVNGEPLHHSPMRDHPLTPMWDSSLSVLMEAQSTGDVGHVDLATVRQSVGDIKNTLSKLTTDYAVVDAETDGDLRQIGRALSGAPFVTGGSGIATGLPQNFLDAGKLVSFSDASLPDVEGRGLIVAGSASIATQGQVKHAAALLPSFEIELDQIARDPNYIQTICDWARAQDPTMAVMIYGTSSHSVLLANQAKYGIEKSGQMLEAALSAIASELVQGDFAKIIVAGGETSGAVVSALNVRTLRVCKEIEPGVPWCELDGERKIAIALKSGNFGQKSFFVDALGMLDG